MLAIEGVPRHRPLYLAGAYTKSQARQTPTLARLMARYGTFTKDSVLPTLLANYSLVTERELLAAIDFVVCEGT